VTSAGRIVAAGRGALDYDRYLALLRDAGYAGAVVLHGLQEAEVPGALTFLRERTAAAGAATGEDCASSRSAEAAGEPASG
jgi:hypothetical protein